MAEQLLCKGRQLKCLSEPILRCHLAQNGNVKPMIRTWFTSLLCVSRTGARSPSGIRRVHVILLHPAIYCSSGSSINIRRPFQECRHIRGRIDILVPPEISRGLSRADVFDGQDANGVLDTRANVLRIKLGIVALLYFSEAEAVSNHFEDDEPE